MPERLHTIVAGLLAFAEVVRRVNPKTLLSPGQVFAKVTS